MCDEQAVRFIVERSRRSIEWLIKLGVPFTRDASEFGFHLTREGGHSHRRIIHAADATGHAVQVTLADLVRMHPNITLLEHHLAIDLIVEAKRCTGVYVQATAGGPVRAIATNQVILAAGGAGKVYLYTTNPDTATGDGIAMAWRAGCRVSNTRRAAASAARPHGGDRRVCRLAQRVSALCQHAGARLCHGRRQLRPRSPRLWSPPPPAM